jgi:hypothetical protein
MPERSRALENHGLSLEKSTRALKPIPLGSLGCGDLSSGRDWASFRAHFKLKPPLREPAPPYSRAERALLRTHILASVI